MAWGESDLVIKSGCTRGSGVAKEFNIGRDQSEREL
jgi:hypothetical protein